LGFAALGYPADDLTDAMVWYLAAIQQPDGHWVPGMLRPPLGGAEIVATVLAMRSLQLYPLEARKEEIAERVSRAGKWLRAAKPRIHQERVYRLLGLGWVGVPSANLSEAIAKLFDEQREDGGWAQLPGLESDAWATGQTLVALHTAGGLPTTHRSYQRGIAFLLRTQFDDGSWYVRTRTWPFQPHFDSHFPHGKDQWISAPATAWSVMALTLAVEPSANVVVGQRKNSRSSSSQTTESPSSVSSGEKSKKPAQVTNNTVDFVKDIKPILQQSCVGCHGTKKPEGGFRVTTRALLLKGGESGEAAIIPIRSDESPLLRFVSGQVEDLEMPPLKNRDKYPALTKKQIDRLRAWIQQGAPWPNGIVLE
jgi:hypothetical protein